MATWRLAKSLEVLRNQIDIRWSKRERDFDGTIGDVAHQKAGTSDHLPNASGVVTAFDLTNDPPNECHCALIAEAIRVSKDRRVKYLIFNHFICRAYAKVSVPAWKWAPYTGPNAHDHHLHISVVAERADDPAPWKIV